MNIDKLISKIVTKISFVRYLFVLLLFANCVIVSGCIGDTSAYQNNKEKENLTTTNIPEPTELLDNNTNITPSPDMMTDQEDEDKKENLTLFESHSFEDGINTLLPRGATLLNITDLYAKSGKNSLAISRRTDYWRGARYDLNEYAGEKIYISAWVMYNAKLSNDFLTFNITLQSSSDAGTEYNIFSSVEAPKGEWVFIEADIDVPENITQALVYFELNDYCDFYLDDFMISSMNQEDIDFTKEPALKDIYQDYFYMGVAASNSIMTTKNYSSLIQHHFNSLTVENEMKPQYILDQKLCQSNVSKYNEHPALDFSKFKVGLEYAKKHHMLVRGHTLVGHSQTPNWFFTVDYTDGGELTDRETMLKRMESYIKQILEFTNENYPGIVYAWDVVNEAINPGDKQENGFRVNHNLWYEIIGEDYVYYAFLYAKKYAANDVLLFYNDYNTYDKVEYIKKLTKPLLDEGLLDGIGMECHLSLTYPSVEKVLNTIKDFSALGYEIHITQLDVAIHSEYGANDEDFNKQAVYYKNLFAGFKHLVNTKQGNIKSVTVWGTTDNRSFKSDKSPVLFDKDFQPKSAFYGVIGDDTIKN